MHQTVPYLASQPIMPDISETSGLNYGSINCSLGCFDWSSPVGFIVLYSCLFANQTPPLTQNWCFNFFQIKGTQNRPPLTLQVEGHPSITQRLNVLKAKEKLLVHRKKSQSRLKLTEPANLRWSRMGRHFLEGKHLEGKIYKMHWTFHDIFCLLFRRYWLRSKLVYHRYQLG